MGHFSDDSNNDPYTSGSAEEWSKPSTPVERPAEKPEPTDRWGSPIPDPSPTVDKTSWDPEPVAPSTPLPAKKKSGSKWWVILIIVLVVLCLCACLVIFGLPALGLSLIPAEWFQF